MITMTSEDFPLSDARSAFLSWLKNGGVEDLGAAGASLQTQSWARRRDLIEVIDPHETWGLSDIGKQVLSLEKAHQPSMVRKLLGHSPIKGGGSYYGTILRCSCGEFKTSNNESPNKGGKRDAMLSWRNHISEKLAKS